jgi:geranylgeranyl diphosphate synthase type I
VAHDTLTAIDTLPLSSTEPLSSSEVPQAVEEVLTAFVTTQAAYLSSLDRGLDLLARAARDAVLSNGKRLRPQLAWWGWRANGGQGPPSAVLPALASLELLHAFALVHDDVMDRSDTRRGRPSTHRALAAEHVRSGMIGDPRCFGDSAAILVGDLCLVWADRLMAQAMVDRDRVTAARFAYDHMRIEAIAGQFLDILGDESPTWTVEQALRTARLKTAAYTVTRPLHFGAVLAGPVDPELSAALTRYGSAIGEAFQLCDDLLGAFGEPAVTGKPAGDDLVSGKKTVLLEIARGRASARQLDEIEEILRRWRGRRGDTSEAARRLAGIVRATGAPDAVAAMISERIDEGRRAVATVSMDLEAREALVQLADSLARRPA